MEAWRLSLLVLLQRLHFSQAGCSWFPRTHESFPKADGYCKVHGGEIVGPKLILSNKNTSMEFGEYLKQSGPLWYQDSNHNGTTCNLIGFNGSKTEKAHCDSRLYFVCFYHESCPEITSQTASPPDRATSNGWTTEPAPDAPVNVMRSDGGFEPLFIVGIVVVLALVVIGIVAAILIIRRGVKSRGMLNLEKSSKETTEGKRPNNEYITDTSDDPYNILSVKEQSMHQPKSAHPYDHIRFMDDGYDTLKRNTEGDFDQ